MSTVTDVTATAPLTSSGGTTPNIALTTPLSVANGGTGATSAATAPFAALSPAAPQSGSVIVTGGFQTAAGTGLTVGTTALLYADTANATIKIPSAGGSLFVQNHTGSANPLQVADNGTVVCGGPVTGVTSLQMNGALAGATTGSFSGAVSAGPGGISPQWFNVVDYGAMAKQTHAAAHTVIGGTGTDTISIAAAKFANGDHLTLFDTDVCACGHVTAGGGTTSITVVWDALFVANGVNAGTSYGWTFAGTPPCIGDDTAAIAACVAAAQSYASTASSKAAVYFPPGYVSTAAPISLPGGVSVHSFGATEIVPGGAGAGDCFIFVQQTSADFTGLAARFQLPSPHNFPGAGLAFYGAGNGAACAYQYVEMSTIRNCRIGVLYRDNVLNTTVNLNIIDGCGYAIFFGSKDMRGAFGDALQGNALTLSTIISCGYGVYFQGISPGTRTSAAVTVPANGNSVSVPNTGNAFPSAMNGATASKIIVYDTAGHAFFGHIVSGAGTSTLSVLCEGRLGNTNAGDAVASPAYIVPNYPGLINVNAVAATVLNGNVAGTYVAGIDGLYVSQLVLRSLNLNGLSGAVASLNGGVMESSIFECGAYINPPNSYGMLSGLVTPWPTQNNCNIWRSLGNAATNSNYLAATASNSRSSFAGGAPVMSTKYNVSMVMPAMTAGQTVDFYVYSPYTLGNQYQPTFQLSSSSAPIAILACEDESVVTGIDAHRVDNQVHLRVIALGTVTNGTVVYGSIEFGR